VFSFPPALSPRAWGRGPGAGPPPPHTSPKDVTNKRERGIYYYSTYRTSGLQICLKLFTRILRNRGVYMRTLVGT
jgi:hypothetical protein